MKTEMEERMTGLITDEEIRAAEGCMDVAERCGAQQVRVVLSKSTLDACSMLNGGLDKVSRSSDRSVMLYLFVDGKYGTFSTNMVEAGELEKFVKQAVGTVKMLAEDRCRRLPEPERTEKGALTGRELGLYDPAYEHLDSEERHAAAKRECIFYIDDAIAGHGSDILSDRHQGVRIVSEELEYSDSVDDSLTMDSNGFRGRHTETSFAVCSEITVEAPDGRKYSGYWWDSSPFSSGLVREECSKTALERALSGIGPKRHRSGRFHMVVDRTVISRLSANHAESFSASPFFMYFAIGINTSYDRFWATEEKPSPMASNTEVIFRAVFILVKTAAQNAAKSKPIHSETDPECPAES